MKFFLCSEPGVKDPTRRYMLTKIKEWGYHGTRTEVDRDPDVARVQVRRYSRREMEDLDVIFLIAGGKMRFDGGTGPALEPLHIAAIARRAAEYVKEFGVITPGRFVAFEIGNEPDMAVDLYRKSPEKFGEAVDLAEKAIRNVLGPEVPVISGGISNLHKKRLRYLGKALRIVSKDIIPGFHRYKTETRSDVPLPGYTTREEEVGELLRVTSGHSLPFHTEGGNHDRISKVKTGWFKREDFRKTEVQVAADNEFDVELFHGFGISVFTKYQIRDGLSGDPYETEAGFGDMFTNADGSPGRDKITSTRVKEWREKYSGGKRSFTEQGIS